MKVFRTMFFIFHEALGQVVRKKANVTGTDGGGGGGNM